MSEDAPATRIPSATVEDGGSGTGRPATADVRPVADDPTSLVPAVRGALPPRSTYASDAWRTDLGGPWRFRLWPQVRTGVALDDPGSGWPTLPVPSHWQLHGYGAPAYTNIVYPFPLDAPRVPDDNPTGEYRRDLTLTERQLDQPGRFVLRFDGVDSCLVLGVNGVEIGTSTGSRLPVEFDVTGALRPGANLLAARVSQWSTGSYLEDQDQWWLSGIFRDVTLLFQPDGGVADVAVRADYDAATGLGTVRVDVTAAELAGVRVRLPELGLDLAPGEAATVAVEPWSAEVPRLYDVEVATAAERVVLRTGFRRVAVVDGTIRVNGVPVLFRGVNRHEFSPGTGRALSREVMEQDVLLMKRHHVNAVRTSHYPPHPAFLELCDELGLYVVDECDLETHGYELDGWAGNPTDDPAWTAAYVERAQRMVVRDRNHPSVVMWSLGNEAGRGRNIAAMALAVRALDDRPLHYEPDQRCDVVDVYSRMYASADEVAAIGRRAEPPLTDLAADARRRSLPFVLCEYAHAMGNGPGGLAEYERLFESSPRLQGGFVWEWIDHGLSTRTPDGTPYFGYGGDFGERLHDGSFICDGLLLPDRTPSPGLVEFAAVHAPLRITPVEQAGPVVRIRSRYQVVDTADVAFTWRLEADGVPVAEGVLDVPVLPPGSSVDVAVPVPDAVSAAALRPIEAPRPLDEVEWWATVEATTGPRPWALDGLVVGRGQVRVAAPEGAAPAPGQARRSRGEATPLTERGEVHQVGPAGFDAAGRLVRLGAMAVARAGFDAWRPPTENDRYVGVGDVMSNLAAWRRAGLDRLEERVDAVDVEDGELVVRTRAAGAGTGNGFGVRARWSATPDGVRLVMLVEPQGRWLSSLPRLGCTLAVPCPSPGDAAVEWFGLGPGEAYADSRTAARVGRWSGSVRELATDYVVPQENGCRKETRWARLTWDGGPGAGQRQRLTVLGDPWVDLTVREWSPAELTSAAHAHELPRSTTLWIHLDAGQEGLGSATCGPGVAVEHRYLPGPTTLALELRV